jgi:hypothetical protein
LTKNWRPVNLRAEVVAKVEKRIQSEYEGALRKPAIGAYIENLVLPLLEEGPGPREARPFLEELSVDSEKVFIRDNRLDKVAELTFKNRSSLFCNLEHSDNCVHIGFAWTIPEVFRMLIRSKETPISSRHD